MAFLYAFLILLALDVIWYLCEILSTPSAEKYLKAHPESVFEDCNDLSIFP